METFSLGGDTAADDTIRSSVLLEGGASSLSSYSPEHKRNSAAGLASAEAMDQASRDSSTDLNSGISERDVSEL